MRPGRRRPFRADSFGGISMPPSAAWRFRTAPEFPAGSHAGNKLRVPQPGCADRASPNCSHIRYSRKTAPAWPGMRERPGTPWAASDCPGNPLGRGQEGQRLQVRRFLFAGQLFDRVSLSKLQSAAQGAMRCRGQFIGRSSFQTGARPFPALHCRQPGYRLFAAQGPHGLFRAGSLDCIDI